MKTRRELSEEGVLFARAAFSKNHSRQVPEDEDHRVPYKRDVDRIIESKAYARYVDKTQVVYLLPNDHISNRALHVQLVSNFARGIGEVLRLNTNLIEAIALGHDVGHPPFGHEGEGYLDALTMEFGVGHYAHPWQSCRLFTILEPLNLGLAVLDGFLCHDGGLRTSKLEPVFDKTWQDHEKELLLKKENPDVGLMPASLEGCLVKFCDTVCYLARDLEDAIRLGLIRREDVPRTQLGASGAEMKKNVASDLIEESLDRDYIACSPVVLEAINTIRTFNFERIYFHPKLKSESTKIERGYRYLFTMLLEDFKTHGTKSYLFEHYLRTKPEKYLQSWTGPQFVVDYISGMTDSYFIRTLENLVVPKCILS